MPPKKRPGQNPRKNKSWVQLSKHFVDQWPEVLQGMKLDNMPVKYLKFCDINLKNNVKVRFDVQKDLNKHSENKIAGMLKTYIATHQNNIKNIDLKFDVTRLKADISKKTGNLLGKTFKK